MGKEKLIKWYGWIFILFICLTPLVIIFLPKLMLNVNRINSLLKDSRIPEKQQISGKVSKISWHKTYDGDLGCLQGHIDVIDDRGHAINCIFKKYIGPKFNQTININHLDNLTMTGTFSGDTFLIRNIQNHTNSQTYSTEPAVSVY